MTQIVLQYWILLIQFQTQKVWLEFVSFVFVLAFTYVDKLWCLTLSSKLIMGKNGFFSSLFLHLVEERIKINFQLQCYKCECQI